MGVASGCGEQEVGVASGSGWNLWVWLLGVVVRRYIDFLILLIPTPLVSVLFCSSIPTFCSFLKCFSFFIYNLGNIQYYRVGTRVRTCGAAQSYYGGVRRAQRMDVHNIMAGNNRLESCFQEHLQKKGQEINHTK